MKYIIILFIFSFSLIQAQNTQTLKIIIEKGVLTHYKNFIKEKDPIDIKDFSTKWSNRSVVELVLLQQALFKGGMKVDLKFVISPTSLRELLQLKNAKGATTATSLWLYSLKSIQEDVYITKPLIRNGEFEAGLYTLETNKNILALKTLEDIQKLTAISNKKWVPDWQTLTNLKLKKMHSTLKWKYMIRMILAKRGDFMLASFQPTDDLSFTTEGLKFIPIPNLKVGLQGSRHFAISKKYKNSKEIFTALNRGLDILRYDGTIKKAYQESGFFNHKVNKWKKLN